MDQRGAIARREVETEDAFELKMRTAAEFICLAGQFRSDVWVIYEGRRYNGRSMRDMLSMVTACRSRMELVAEGPDAEAALEALAQAVRPCRIRNVQRSDDVRLPADGSDTMLQASTGSPMRSQATFK